MMATILGSGTGEPSLKRSPPGMLLKIGTDNILVDAGSGTMQRLLERGCNYQNIDYILFSHLHPDHTIDLISFLFVTKNPRAPRRKDLNIVGPLGLKEFFYKLLQIYENALEIDSYKIDIKEMAFGSIRFNGWSVGMVPVLHTPSSIAYRFNYGDKSLLYSGDTDYCKNIVELGRDVDVMVLECSFPDEAKIEGHLTPKDAGRIASEANAKRLVLTHLYPLCDDYDIINECKAEFNGEVALSGDMMDIEV